MTIGARRRKLIQRLRYSTKDQRVNGTMEGTTTSAWGEDCLSNVVSYGAFSERGSTMFSRLTAVAIICTSLMELAYMYVKKRSILIRLLDPPTRRQPSLHILTQAQSLFTAPSSAPFGGGSFAAALLTPISHLHISTPTTTTSLMQRHPHIESLSRSGIQSP